MIDVNISGKGSALGMAFGKDLFNQSRCRAARGLAQELAILPAEEVTTMERCQAQKRRLALGVAQSLQTLDSFVFG